MVRPVWLTIIFAPNQLMTRMQAYTVSCMIGMEKEMMRSAEMEFLNRSSAAPENFSSSYSSRTNALTTRIAPTFSLTTPLTVSYLRNI